MFKRGKVILFLATLSMVVFSGSCLFATVPPWSGGNLTEPSDVFAGNVGNWEGEDPVSVYIYHQGDEVSIDVGDINADFRWHPTTSAIDLILIRTTEQDGSVPLGLDYDEEAISLDWETADEGLIFGPSDDLDTLDWTFEDAVPGRVLAGRLHAESIDQQAVSNDLLAAVIQLDDQPVHLEIYGLPDMEDDGEPVLFYTLVGDSLLDLNTTIDLGTVIAEPDDTGYLGFFNLGTWVTPIDFDDSDVSLEGYYLAEKSWEDQGEPGILLPQDDEDDHDGPVEIWNCDQLTPGTAAAVQTKMSVGEANGSFDIVFTTGETLSLTFSWAQTLVDDEGKRVGIPGGIAADDIGDYGISDVLAYGDISGDVTPGDFTFNYTAVPDDFIALVSMDVENPDYSVGSSDALPLVLQFAFPASLIDHYDENLSDTLREDVEGLVNEGASLEEIEDALADYFSIRKEWSNGDFLEIDLDHPAVDVQLLDFAPSLDEPPVVVVTVRVIIVDGGVAGDYYTVQVDGVTYLLIYDGEEDGFFRDPIKLIESSGSDTGGGGGGGCNASGMTPVALLLLVPMLLAAMKK